jgi:hypothetical protein
MGIVYRVVDVYVPLSLFQHLDLVTECVIFSLKSILTINIVKPQKNIMLILYDERVPSKLELIPRYSLP